MVISYKDRNKMNRSDLEELKTKGILSEDTVFLIEDKAKNVNILNKYLQKIII